MSDKKMPAFRIKYRSADKQNFDVGVAWEGRFEGSYDLKPETQTTGGQYPKMALSEAVRRAENRDGWLTIQAVRPKGQQQRDKASDKDWFGGGDDFGDEVPF